MATEDELRERQRVQWRSAAPGWERWASFYERAFEPLAAWFVEATDMRPGASAIDVACGIGQPAIALARAGGQVLATDLSADMLAVAERRAKTAGVDVTFRTMDAEALDVADDTFDAATCAFGLMFLPHPERAVAELRRVLGPGGRFALGVWGAPDDNPFFTVLMRRVSALVPGPPPDPRAPGAFRFAADGALRSLLDSAGLTEHRIERHDLWFRFDSADQFWELQTDMAAPLRATLQRLAAADVARLRDDVRAELEHHTDGRGILLRASALCAWGTVERA